MLAVVNPYYTAVVHLKMTLAEDAAMQETSSQQPDTASATGGSVMIDPLSGQEAEYHPKLSGSTYLSSWPFLNSVSSECFIFVVCTRIQL